MPVAMSVAEQLPLAEVKNRLSEVVEQVETQHARVTITKHGRPAAVVISADELDSLEETLRVPPEKAAAAVIELVYGPLDGNPQRIGKPLRFESEGLHVARRG